jgi:CxxC motif-containing protein (DUF1111 family)
MNMLRSLHRRPSLYLSATLVMALAVLGSAQNGAVEAPAGFTTPTGCPTTNLPSGIGACASNGFQPSGDTFANAQDTFEEQEDLTKGLGPVYNDKSCANCHQNPVTGGISQVTELRVGHTDGNGNFVAPTIPINNGANSIPSRSLVNDRAICPQAQERTPGTETISTFRTSLNVLGDGFVESIDSNTLAAIANNQPNQSGGRIAGEFIQVPVLEAPGNVRGGRFGWKNQHASLLSFSADAYVNEMGVTSRLQPTDTTTVCKTTSDPEDHPDANGLADIDHFANFMRATKVPPRDTVAAATSDAQAGASLFNQIGCNICHVSSITTAPAGTVINGGAFTVPASLGNKIIHPYSDFLLHNVGTGDGIVQNGPADTANKMRTAPLWGMRTRDRLMHDGESLTRNTAILRHAGEATFVINNYRSLSTAQKNQLIAFLNSL